MRTTITLTAALCAGLLLSAAPALRAQSLDPTFLPTILKAPPSTTLSLQSGVNTLAVQPDGKILAAGGFDFVNGNLTGRLQRFNPDGTVDATFNAGTGASGFVTTVLVQPDGKILVAGGFNAFNGTAVANLVRLNANGTLDATFSVLSPDVPRQPMNMVLQPDGKILVSGLSVSDPAYPGLVRLNANGTRDPGFSAGSGFGGGLPYALALQPDGKIVVGGAVTTFNGQPSGALVRLNTDGSLDTSFSTTNLLAGTVRTVLRQPNGSLLVGGSLMLPTSPTTSLLRLLPTGALDNTFTPGAGPNGSVLSLVPLSSGAVLLGGNFTQYDGAARGRVARISADGVLDATFAPTAGANATVMAVAATGTGQVLVGGVFTQYNGTDQPALARLGTSGTLDAAFAPLLEARGTIAQAVPLSSGQLLVSGRLSVLNGATLPGLPSLPRRLNPDGSLDPGYAAAAAGSLQSVLPGGEAYVLESSTSLRRLAPGGALDNSFALRPLAGRFGSGGNSASPSLLGAKAQPDGKLLVYGLFSSYDGVLRNGLVRLNADGSLDATFTPPASTTVPATTNDFRRVTAAYVLPSGKILYQWTSYFNTAQTFLTRLNADGTLDNTFSIGTGPANSLGLASFFNVLPLAGDKLLIWGGDFTSVNGQYAPYGFTRLSATGAVDPTFSGLTQFYQPRAVQPDGKIVATTGSSALSNASNQLVRLNADGSSDPSFAPVAVPTSFFTGDDILTGVVQQADGKLVLFGSFRYVAGQVRIGLARLTNPTLATTAGKAIQPLTLYPNPAHDHATVQLPAGAAQLRVLDLQGRLVQQHPLPARQPEATLDLAGMPAGLYLVQVVGSAGLYQQRVVVTP